MVDYEVTVYTGHDCWAGTLNNVYIKLVGTEGESHHTWLLHWTGPLAFRTGAVSTFTVSTPATIGKLVLIELNMQCALILDQWFPSKVEVKSPEGDKYIFPIYRWISDTEVHRFREGAALTPKEDTNPLGKYDRQQELMIREKVYCWDVYKDEIPHCMKADGPNSLPNEVRFSYPKDLEFKFTALEGLAELKLEGLADCKERWTNIEDISRVFCCKWTDLSEYCHKHWKDDAFFGYQYLNGVNPMIIKRCSALPENFPVDKGLIYLPGETSLSHELKEGNIFLCDYKLLDGVETNIINGKRQYLTAPLVLLHKTPDDKLMPIAIQLKQIPADDNPIFYPSDSEYDWLTAKIFVRSADFNFQELSVHLMRTHLLAEVFAVSLLRNLPMVHPLYKLLIPHTRYTLQIDYLARNLLLSDIGAFTLYTASGGKGMFTILKRAMAAITYRSLCIPEDIADRGLESVPNFHYRGDGLKLWKIIHSFVQGILSLYYKNDVDVQQDPELQKWIQDIFEQGFLSKAETGIPQSFTTVAELVKFVTMVIFTSSAQHSAVNAGQYDYGGWMPNTPTSLQLPPPTTKGTTSQDTILKTLPDINATVHGMAVLWLLTKQSTDFVPLGQYPDEHFTEEIPRRMIKEFQGKLEIESLTIKIRNENIEIPYRYLNPGLIENSVAI